jgi:hypothetical protein
VVSLKVTDSGASCGALPSFSEGQIMDEEKYRVIRNDGSLYMECDRDTALRLVRQLNEKYKGVYSYRAERLVK